jgi:uncharacterized membrane protein YGL010W
MPAHLDVESLPLFSQTLASGDLRGYMYLRPAPEKNSMTSFSQHMSQYDHEHTNPWNKLMHGIGIPIILAGILLAVFTHWRLGLALFVAGWILLFTGHRIEGNKPAFFQGLIYFLVGPIWIAKELKDAVLGASHKSPSTH